MAGHGAISSYRDLRVWQAGVDLVEEIYRLTQSFPKHEIYGLAGQMQRTAVSVSSNIAEGHVRRYSKRYLHHLSVAQASLAELETQIEIAARPAYLPPEKAGQLRDRTGLLGRQLHALWNALVAKRPATPTPDP